MENTICKLNEVFGEQEEYHKSLEELIHMEQEEFIQKIQQHGSTLEVVITKIMDIITAFDIYEDYYYWPLIRT